jgi:hypothetical protein
MLRKFNKKGEVHFYFTENLKGKDLKEVKERVKQDFEKKYDVEEINGSELHIICREEKEKIGIINIKTIPSEKDSFKVSVMRV